MDLSQLRGYENSQVSFFSVIMLGHLEKRFSGIQAAAVYHRLCMVNLDGRHGALTTVLPFSWLLERSWTVDSFLAGCSTQCTKAS